ncbi:hypothetical protein [Streptomyces sp. 7N604]|uniref:hypothetical protein n=1 Tax=Streptomyces sp. 7N604 TaxID=3457415 RepID=UPI003FD0A3DB
MTAQDVNDVEQAFIRSVQAEDIAGVHQLLPDMWVYQPIVMRGPDQVQHDAVVWKDGDHRFLRTYTSKQRATEFLAGHSANAAPNYVSATRFTHLMRDWPTLSGIVINPGSDSEFRLAPGDFTTVTGPRWAALSYGDDGVPLLRRLSSRIAQVDWYITMHDDVPFTVYVVVAKVHADNGRPVYDFLSRKSEMLAEELARDLGPQPDGLRFVPRFEAARFVGVGVNATVEAAPGADEGSVQSRTQRALYELLNPIADGRDGAGWPLGRTVDRAVVREALSNVTGVADVSELRMHAFDPATNERREDVDEVELAVDTTVISLDHNVVVTPAEPLPPAAEPASAEVQPVSAPANYRARQASIAVGVAVIPVVLGTILQITDKASAPVWAVVVLIVFTGVATLIATVRTARADDGSSTTSGERAPGKLEVNDVKLERVAVGLIRADFRVTNTGGSTVSIHAVEFESVAVEFDLFVLGVQEVSAVYDVDITPLQAPGASVSCDIAQQIAPGEVDRFVIQLKSTIPHTFRRFAIRPILMTNFGPVSGPLLELA